jgi:Ran GTPase-activating protein (RanGAP) involved in mRNA processing and transport
LVNCGLTMSIFGRLKSNKTIKELDLSQNNFSKLSPDLSHMLALSRSLTTLTLNRCSLANPAIDAIGRVLHKNTTLQVLRLQANVFTALTEFCHSECFNGLKQLDLSHNHMLKESSIS